MENPKKVTRSCQCPRNALPKAKDRNPVHSLLTEVEATGLEQIMRCEDYSNLRQLLAVTAYLLRFAMGLKRKVGSDTTDEPRELVLAVDEISVAGELWIIESVLSLVKDKHFAAWKEQFGLFLDQRGIWRCGGLLSNADIPFSTRHPILLPRGHNLTTLIVRSAHKRILHNGVKETLTELRSRYWIVKGRQLVKSVIYKCVTCRRFDGVPYHPPLPPPLPIFRVSEEPPFTYTGVDFAGPLYTKASDVARSGKVWICLYTCCVVRAVHLDLVPDMTATTFLRSFKRFTARRGLPRKGCIRQREDVQGGSKKNQSHDEPRGCPSILLRDRY